MHPHPSAMLVADRYSMPTAVRVGGTGTIAPEASGYLLTGFANDTFAYLAKAMVSGRFYWEFEVLTFNALPGLADDVASAVSFGGYAGTNGGVYLTPSLASTWRESAWGGSFSPGSFGPLSAGDVIGFASDTGGPLKIFRNSGLATEVTFATPPSPAYAHAGFQGGSGRFRLGPGGCIYAPPAGFEYL